VDFTLDTDEEQIQSAVATVVSRYRSSEATGLDLDRELMKHLDEAGFLDIVGPGGSLLNAALVVEQSMIGGGNAPVAARAIVARTLLEDPPLTLGLADSLDGGVVRFGGQCDGYLAIDGDRAVYLDGDAVQTTPIASRWGYPLEWVVGGRGEDLGPGSAAVLRRAWSVSLAVEMAAAMQRPVAIATEHVTGRRQFGKAIGAYQAVQHRLAKAHVLSQGALWLARRAAAHPANDVFAGSAVTYAASAAREVIEHTHQVTGAIGITTEYDLVKWTGRLMVLRQELGGTRAHARRLGQARWRSAASSSVPSARVGPATAPGSAPDQMPERLAT
jgi:hypothetical protein